MVRKIGFKNRSHNAKCDLSPLVNNIALAECVYEGDDKVTGKPLHGSYLRIYDAYECELLAEKKLETQDSLVWKVRFSACGRYLQLDGKDEKHTFEMRQSAK